MIPFVSSSACRYSSCTARKSSPIDLGIRTFISERSRVHTEIEIFNFCVLYLKYNSCKIAGIAQINIGKIGMFIEYCINPFLLIFFTDRNSFCGTSREFHEVRQGKADIFRRRNISVHGTLIVRVKRISEDRKRYAVFVKQLEQSPKIRVQDRIIARNVKIG